MTEPKMTDGKKEIELIKIEAIVRDEMFVDVRNALAEIGINGMTACQVAGYGAQRGVCEFVRGQKVNVHTVPKIKFEIVVSSGDWEEKTIETIKKTAFTGHPGDGKIFSYPIRRAVKIRTGETGSEAVQSQV